MRVLALDTATAATTVAAVSLVDGETRIHAQFAHIDPRRHGETLAPLVRDALAEAGWGPGGLDLVVVGVGPGPFTGLRVGVAFALAFGAGAAVPVVGACTLDAVAAGAARLTPGLAEVDVAVRSRRVEVTWARYALADGFRRVAGPIIRPDVDVATLDRPVAGDAADLARQPVGPRYPEAADLAQLVLGRLQAGDSLLPPMPIYLRPPDAVPGVAAAAAGAP